MLKLIFSITLLLTSALSASKAYAPNEDCKACHTQIYDEFSASMHANTTPQKDPIHNAIWSKHPQNKKFQKYGCGKCHTPTAPKMSIPTMDSKLHQEAISCAYCHRIKSIKHHAKSNENITTDKEKEYFGTRKLHIDSPYHSIVTDGNKLMKDGNVCIGCHSHKMNKFKLNVCSTNIKNEMDGENCVSCHMPKIDGTVSTLHKTKKHSFHGFPGSHFNADMLSKYVIIKAKKQTKSFNIKIENHSSHSLLLHPLRVAVLKTSVKRDGKIIKLKDEIFVRVIGHDGKPAMPWKASVTLKDTMLKANETRDVKFDFTLKDGDEVNVTLGWFLVNPKVVKKLGLQDDKMATKFTTFKHQVFKF